MENSKNVPQGGAVGKLRELSLFSGFGGFSLALRQGGIPTQTVGYVEIDPYAQQILLARMHDGYLDPAPIITDIKRCDFTSMAGLVDLVTAGFPCQPHSYAGTRRIAKGLADDRNLWPDTLRAIGEVGPRYILLENVPGILSGTAERQAYGGTVVGQLSEAGYDCQWNIVSAADAGANHLRKRWWCWATRQVDDPQHDGLP